MPYYFWETLEEARQAELVELAHNMPDLEVRYRTPLNGRDGWYYRTRIENSDGWHPWWGGMNLQSAFSTKELALEHAFAARAALAAEQGNAPEKGV
jgi:hypothetical protein